jgi:hypothetical protein
MHPMRRIRSRALALAAIGALSLPLDASRAAITAPALELIRIQAARGASGVWLRIDGSFPLGDLVQQPRELQVLVRESQESARFVRFYLPRRGYAGESAALLDGFDAEDIAAVAAASQPEPGARLLEIASGRIELLLPATFPSGEAEAHLYLVYRGEPLLSNPLEFTIEGAQP